MQELSINQMRAISGGVSPEEYCTILYNLIMAHAGPNPDPNVNTWGPEDWANIMGGWASGGCSDYYTINIEVTEGGD